MGKLAGKRPRRRRTPVAAIVSASALVPVPPFAKLRPYRRIVLVSRERQLDLLDPNDAETLVATSDWLAARIWSDRGGNAIPLEWMLLDEPAIESPDGHYEHAYQWSFDGETDRSLFHGVSLGKLLAYEVAFLSRAYLRVVRSLELLCRRAQPRELVLMGVRAEFDLLDGMTVRLLAHAAASRSGATFVDRTVNVRDADDPLPEISGFRLVLRPETGIRSVLRTSYAALIERLFGIGIRNKKLPRVLLALNGTTLRGMLNGFADYPIVPVVLAEQMPKTPAFLRYCNRRGIGLAHLPGVSLDRADEKTLSDIAERLKRLWPDTSSDIAGVIGRHLRARVIDDGSLRHSAVMVKRAIRLFRNWRPSRLVVGDVGNPFCRLMLEVAVQHRTPVDELMNGMYVANQRLDARCGDARSSPPLSRALVWGRQQQEWLTAIGSTLPSVRIGHPGIHAVPVHKSSQGRRVLVLPVTVDAYEMVGLRANIFALLVDTVSALVDAGYAITVKLHPGTPNQAYYERVLRHHNLDITVLKTERLQDILVDTDVVVGPANSGALVETMACGRPYYVMLPSVTSIDPAYLKTLIVVRSGRELIDVLARGIAPSPSLTLNYLASLDEGYDVAARAWRAIAKVAGHGERVLASHTGLADVVR